MIGYTQFGHFRGEQDGCSEVSQLLMIPSGERWKDRQYRGSIPAYSYGSHLVLLLRSLSTNTQRTLNLIVVDRTIQMGVCCAFFHNGISST